MHAYVEGVISLCMHGRLHAPQLPCRHLACAHLARSHTCRATVASSSVIPPACSDSLADCCTFAAACCVLARLQSRPVSSAPRPSSSRWLLCSATGCGDETGKGGGSTSLLSLLPGTPSISPCSGERSRLPDDASLCICPAVCSLCCVVGPTAPCPAHPLRVGACPGTCCYFTCNFCKACEISY